VNESDLRALLSLICLDLLKDPVTVPCGHSFCMVGIYSCPQSASPAPRYAGAGDVECDFCTGRKLRAIKSCLMCLASFCEAHLKPHYEVPGLKKHNLVKASTQLQEKICSQHDEVMKIYCRTDQSCICYLCTMDKHRGHDTVPATTERTEKHLKKLLEKLQQEMADLKRRHTELEQLSHTEDHIHFLQVTLTDLQRKLLLIKLLKLLSAKVHEAPINKAVWNPKFLFSLICSELLHFSSPPLSSSTVFLLSVEFPVSLYFCRLTLDPNTANRFLILSEKNRVVKWSSKVQSYSDHTERFDGWEQVLSKESVCGRCYWEVEWSGGCVYISVSYKGISRKGWGNDCGFGRNSQSWSLVCSSSLSFYHNNINTVLSAPPSSRIGVYVDHSAGTLSFYSVSDTMTLLHTLHTTFTQPLYAGFYVERGTVRRST
uniref:B30.2/SPRY domain-containing protein n=1 Tax=Astyanax mexicanus TaxID=7994 RepID=A0A3B1ISJ7_ASTMX